MATINLGRRQFIKDLGLGSAALATAALGSGWAIAADKKADKKGDRRPNIVLILADDMGYSDIGCFGGEMETPAINRLAGRGLKFRNFHNGARCCPSRASLLTGLYPAQTGVGDMLGDDHEPGYRGDLNGHCVTIAEALRPAGYRTYATGKWHVTRFLPPDGSQHNWPLQRGFDRYFGVINGADSYFEPNTLLLDNQPIQPKPGSYLTDSIADHAVQFIRDHGSSHRDQPFFSYVAFTAPHWPLQAHEADIAKEHGRFDAGWDALREQRYRRMIDMGIVDPRWKLSPRFRTVPSWSDAPNKPWELRRMEVYAAQIACMDRGIARITGELERQGIMDNTLLVFLSDNGACAEELTPSWEHYLLHGGEQVSRAKTLSGRPVEFTNDPSVMPGPDYTYQSYGHSWANVSNTPYRLFKSYTHAGGINTPLIVHWPERIHAKGDIRDQPGEIIDLMATFLDVSGATYPSTRDGVPVLPFEGKSLVPTFANHHIDRDAIYFEHEGNGAVLTNDYKLVRRGKRRWELYDVRTDRTELNNLAALKPSLVDQLSSQWTRWALRTKVFPKPERRRKG